MHSFKSLRSLLIITFLSMRLNFYTLHLFVTCACLCFMSCSSPQTEREQYQEAASGIAYSTYKSTSSLVVGTSIKAYNLQHLDSHQLQPVYAHLLLGYFWSISSKPTFAFAEAAICEEDSDPSVRFLAGSLRSITMYQQGWPVLAKEESLLAKQHLPKHPATEVAYEAAVFYLIMGAVHVKENDFAQATFYWAGFGVETGIQWPYKISDAAADLQSGHVQQGLSKIKVITQDPSVPQPLREALAAQITKVESQAGTSVDSSLFWPHLIAALLWEEMKKSSNASLQKLVHLVEGLKEKLPS